MTCKLIILTGLIFFNVNLCFSQNDTLKKENDLFLFDSLKENSPSFMTMTEECKSCSEKFKIKVSINNIYYNTFIISDSAIVKLPSTIRPNDIITIAEFKSKRNLGWSTRITKVKKIEFRFGDKNLVNVKETIKYKLRLTYKLDNFGGDIHFK